MCDLARDPRWGRVAETCGEDPHLSSLCNAAQVRGFQGADPAAADRVAACLKHYVGYSAVAGGRDYNEVELTEWTLRNSHLPSFHAAVQAGALTVMSSFNAIGGIPAVANRHTLTEILRDEWKFPGFVVSDWNAVMETIQWGYAKDAADAARLALAAGNDMEMLTTAFIDTLAVQVESGALPLDVVDEAVRRVLRVKFQVGLFDRPYVDESAYESSILRPDALALARECVAKSTVLLQNDGVLPLARNLTKMALVGPFGDDQREMIGCWSARGKPADVVTLAAALRERLTGRAELTVVKGCDVSLTPPTKTLQDGSVVTDPDAAPLDASLDLESAVCAAKAADVVVMAVGEPCGWTGESRNRAFLSLSGNQQALFDAVAATGKPIVTVVFCGRPLSVPSVFEKSAAVLYAWQPGVQAGPGLADLLLGDVAPSARLSMSVLREVSQAPLYYNYPLTGRPNTSCYYLDMPQQGARFWFGHGLTYTTFAYGPVEVVPAAGETPAMAVATVTNTGTRDGVEVAQLYIRQLCCHEGGRPSQELRGFRRLTLKPGQSEEVRIPLTEEVLGFVRRDGAWQVDDGDYQIWIAPHARTGTPVVYAHTKPAGRDKAKK
jgi:beta-glucosidase